MASAMELWILQTEQRRKFFLIEFVHPDAYIMGQDEVQEDLLLAIEPRGDGCPCPTSAFFACERRQGAMLLQPQIVAWCVSLATTASTVSFFLQSCMSSCVLF